MRVKKDGCPREPGTAGGSGVEATLLMPCLNEEKTLGACIEEAKHWMAVACGEGNYEIVVADNGSEDHSCEIAERAGARVVHVKERGYGSALRAGIAEARGRYVVMADSDLSYDFACVPSVISSLRSGLGLVMGNRFIGGIDPGAMPFLHRYLGNPVLSFIGRLFFGVPVGDFHCGLRGFSRQEILGLNLQSQGMEFASEMVVKSALGGISIGEVPAHLRKDGRDRRPHLRTWRDGWRHLRFLLLFCPTWLFTIPGVALVCVGAGAGILVLPGPASFSGWWGGFTLDVNTLVYSAVFLTGGFQLISTGAFVKVFTRSHGLLPGGRPTIFERFSLEWGVAVGAGLLVLGLAGTICAWGQWADGGFTQLDPRKALRLVVPSATAVALGIQMSITSFLVGVAALVKK